MKTALYIVAIIALAGVSFAGIEMGILIHHLDGDRAFARTQAEKAAANLGAVQSEFITDLRADQSEVHHLLLETALTAMEARKVSADEQKALPAITNNIATATAKLSTAVDTLNSVGESAAQTLTQTGNDVHTVLTTTNERVAELHDVEMATTQTIAEVHVDAADVHELLTSPDTKGMLAHGNHATAEFDGAITDTADYWHSTLHPRWPKRVYSALTSAGISVAKFFY